MAGSRYPSIKVMDYCFNPRHVVDAGKDIYVPCGKCDGCLLHKANEWSIRVGQEIENTPFTIFFTLTYNNIYIPKLFLKPSDSPYGYSWVSNHDYNLRFDGKKQVLRKDDICIDFPFHPIPLQNYDNEKRPNINYMSKRDVQLWLKLLRKDLINTFNYGHSTTKDGLFRYFIISEIGPTTKRSHAHGLIFAKSKEIGDYLLQCGLYKNWQMCDKNRFDDFAHYCDSGARGYVTQYLTCFGDIPAVYRYNKEIKPFRISSKAPAIGYSEIEGKAFAQDVSIGTLEYARTISRLGSKVNVMYPKNYASTFFPKCFQFSKRTLSQLSLVYSCLWQEVRRFGFSFDAASKGLRSILHPLDYAASLKCYKYCQNYHSTPFHYLFLLDNYYYKHSMKVLHDFYKLQEDHDVLKEPLYWISLYNNVYFIYYQSKYNDCFYKVFHNFIEGFGLGNVDTRCFDYYSMYISRFKHFDDYKKEVSSICQGMVKIPKMNELLGIAPTNI